MVVINIDTAKDSKEELRKTIKYLQSLLDEMDDAQVLTLPETSSPSSASSSRTVEESIFTPSQPTTPHPAAEALSEAFAVFDTEEVPSSPPAPRRPGAGLDAESLLAAVEESTAKIVQKNEPRKKRGKGDDDADTFIEIVEYE